MKRKQKAVIHGLSRNRRVKMPNKEWMPVNPCVCEFPQAAPDSMDECCCESKIEYSIGKAYQKKLLDHLIANCLVGAIDCSPTRWLSRNKLVEMRKELEELK